MTKEDAINELQNNKQDDTYIMTDEAIDMAIKALSTEPCEDGISREKAKQFLYERLDRLNDDELYDIFSRIIDDMYNELTPVTPQPKIGHWIPLGNYDEWGNENSYQCSECGDRDTYPDNYCHNCGARMESEQNE